MSDTDYDSDVESARWRYSTHGANASSRAYEYGLLVVKNAFLVSGGGLFFIPAMVGLSAEVELGFAFRAGYCFAAAVFLALVANYIIHVNWMLHEDMWEQVHEIELINIRSAYSRSYQDDPERRSVAEAEHAKDSKWIKITFWIPHAIAIIFLLCLAAAALNLYWAFSIFPESGQ